MVSQSSSRRLQATTLTWIRQGQMVVVGHGVPGNRQLQFPCSSLETYCANPDCLIVQPDINVLEHNAVRGGAILELGSLGLGLVHPTVVSTLLLA